MMAIDYMVRPDHRFQSLWDKINRLHLNYLNADESPRKLDEKKRLEGYINDFLCITQHEHKFCCPETAEVLHRSVENKEDFSPYRAMAAWTAVGAYASNLFAQPWRKEFHEIKTYCGYYKHNLESGLVGAELMLEAMGYKHTDRSTMVLDTPVDPDRVNMVSKDSLVALVELQIIRSIYIEVFKVQPSCTWREVLHYRETHVCSPEQAIKGLTYRISQRRYEEQQLRTQLDYGTMGRYHHSTEHHCPYGPRYHYNYTLPSARYGMLPSPQQAIPPPYPVYHLKPHEVYPGGYYPAVQNGYIPFPVPPPPMCQVPSYSCSVPTAQLIELDTPHEPPAYTTNTHRRSSSDHRVEHEMRKNGERYPSDVYSRSTTSDDLGSRKSFKNKEGNWESWEYVYQGLEEKNGKKKKEDFVEKRRERPASPLDLEETLKKFSLDDLHQLTVPEPKNLKINEALVKIRSEVDGDVKKRENRVSIYDNSSPPKSNSPKQIQNIVAARKPEEQKHMNVDARKLRVKLSDKWECVACTYHNAGTRDVCEMCGKSRSRGGECKPLASGGRQCPQCTLVNEKGATNCEACNHNLKNSPTYI